MWKTCVHSPQTAARGQPPLEPTAQERAQTEWTLVTWDLAVWAAPVVVDPTDPAHVVVIVVRPVLVLRSLDAVLRRLELPLPHCDCMVVVDRDLHPSKKRQGEIAG